MVWGYLVAGAGLLTLFAVLQNRVAHPLLPIRIILDRDRGGSYLAVLLLSVGMFGIFLFLTFYLQQNLGLSPIRTGLAFLPMVGALMLTAISSTAALLPRFGAKPLVAIGMVVASSGLFWLSYLQVTSTYAADVLPALLVIGLGIGMAMAPAMQTATLGVAPSDAGVASATVNTMQQVGGSVGTALLATIASNAASDYLTGRTPTPAIAAEAAVHSYTTAFLWGSAIFLAGAVIAGSILRPGARPVPGFAAPGGAAPGSPVQPTGPSPDGPSFVAISPGIRAEPLRPALFGFVRTPGDSPLPGAALTLIDANGTEVDRVRSGTDGSYRLDAPAQDSYVLICAAAPHQPVAERLTIGPATIRHDLLIGRVPAESGRP